MIPHRAGGMLAASSLEPQRAVLVLAGGESSRMGRPKAWLDLGGRPLLSHVVDIGLSVCPLVVVAASAGQALPELPGNVIRVDDPRDRLHQGPLSGALTGLEALARARVELAYIGSCDTPFISARHIEFMLGMLGGEAAHRAVVPETGPLDDRPHILHALSGAVRVPVARATASALLESGRRAIKDLYEGLGARRVGPSELPDPRAVINCNTPQEWARALAELGSASGTS